MCCQDYFINLTNDIEESMYGDKIYVIHDKKLVCEGKTLSVLNEEKLLKRLALASLLYYN